MTHHPRARPCGSRAFSAEKRAIKVAMAGFSAENTESALKGTCLRSG